MEQVTYGKLMEDSIASVNIYLSNAIREINEKLGDKYAEQHPELIGAYINAVAKEYNAAIIAKSNEELNEQIKESTDQICACMEILADKL